MSREFIPFSDDDRAVILQSIRNWAVLQLDVPKLAVDLLFIEQGHGPDMVLNTCSGVAMIYLTQQVTAPDEMPENIRADVETWRKKLCQKKADIDINAVVVNNGAMLRSYLLANVCMCDSHPTGRAH